MEEQRPIDEAREMEPALKRALYASFEKINATKAALYLAAGQGSGESFELVTSYAYNSGTRSSVDAKDPVVGRLLTTRSPIVLNNLASDSVLAEVLFTQGNQQMMAVPIFGRGRRLVGFIDLRDKAGKKPFDANDTAAAEAIRDEIEKVLASKRLYGLGAVSLVDAPKRRRGHSGRLIRASCGSTYRRPRRWRRFAPRTSGWGGARSRSTSGGGSSPTTSCIACAFSFRRCWRSPASSPAP
jgi:hypothetical protein